MNWRRPKGREIASRVIPQVEHFWRLPEGPTFREPHSGNLLYARKCSISLEKSLGRKTPNLRQNGHPKTTMHHSRPFPIILAAARLLPAAPAGPAGRRGHDGKAAPLAGGVAPRGSAGRRPAFRRTRAEAAHRAPLGGRRRNAEPRPGGAREHAVSPLAHRPARGRRAESGAAAGMRGVPLDAFCWYFSTRGLFFPSSAARSARLAPRTPWEQAHGVPQGVLR